MYRKNNSGLRVDPWETQHFMFSLEDSKTINRHIVGGYWNMI